MPRIGVILCLLATLLACDRVPQQQVKETGIPKTQMQANQSWQGFAGQFIEDYFVAHPAFAVTAGRHEFDGLLPDWSKRGISKEIARLYEQKRRAKDFAGLNKTQEFERAYLLSRVDRDLFWLETVEWPFRNPAFYFDWMLDSLDPNVYIARPYAPAEQRLKAFIKYAKGVSTATDQIQSNLRTPLPRTYVELGIASFGGLADYFGNEVLIAFKDVGDEALQQELKIASRQAATAMESLVVWLERQLTGASEDYAIGREAFSLMLQLTEGVTVRLDVLEREGQADLQRNLTALSQACGEFAPGKTIPDCVAKVAANKPNGGAVQGARDQLQGLRDFLQQQELVSIPGTQKALVDEAPPYNRSNSAYIDIPGPYEKGLPSVYYIAPPDPQWSVAEQNAYIPGQADLLFTSIHEIWPGHFLQFLHTNRVQSKLGKVFVGYAYAEGWAHYTEEMMWEAGYGAGDPEIHIGQLLNALLRNVRFLSAIGLHTKGMSVDESEAMFKNMAFQDPGNARQQAARGTYDPAYLNYNLGKLLIRDLREEWTRERGGRKAWKDFHDTFLSYGGPPIPLLRVDMLNSLK